MLYISVRESREKAEAYARAKQLPYPVVLDPDVKVTESVGVSGVPTHFLLDREGKVRFRNEGMLKGYEKALEELIGKAPADRKKG